MEYEAFINTSSMSDEIISSLMDETPNLSFSQVNAKMAELSESVTPDVLATCGITGYVSDIFKAWIAFKIKNNETDAIKARLKAAEEAKKRRAALEKGMHSQADVYKKLDKITVSWDRPLAGIGVVFDPSVHGKLGDEKNPEFIKLVEAMHAGSCYSIDPYKPQSLTMTTEDTISFLLGERDNAELVDNDGCIASCETDRYGSNEYRFKCSIKLALIEDSVSAMDPHVKFKTWKINVQKA